MLEQATGHLRARGRRKPGRERDGDDCSGHRGQRRCACANTIVNLHGYTGQPASADANISGFGSTKHGVVGDQAGVSDSGRGDKICDNAISGPGYAARDRTSTLPNPGAPAWVRPVDIYSFAKAIKPYVKGNTYDSRQYVPR